MICIRALRPDFRGQYFSFIYISFIAPFIPKGGRKGSGRLRVPPNDSRWRRRLLRFRVLLNNSRLERRLLRFLEFLGVGRVVEEETRTGRLHRRVDCTRQRRGLSRRRTFDLDLPARKKRKKTAAWKHGSSGSLRDEGPEKREKINQHGDCLDPHKPLAPSLPE